MPEPSAPTAYFVVFSLAFNFIAFLAASLIGLLFVLKYCFAFFALIALFARLAPLVKAIPPGIPKLIKVSVIFPAVVASAFSSKGFISSKKFSTFAAVLLSVPKSIKLAPNEIAPSGIFIIPEAIPDKTDSIVPTLFSSIDSGFLIMLLS